MRQLTVYLSTYIFQYIPLNLGSISRNDPQPRIIHILDICLYIRSTYPPVRRYTYTTTYLSGVVETRGAFQSRCPHIVCIESCHLSWSAWYSTYLSGVCTWWIQSTDKRRWFEMPTFNDVAPTLKCGASWFILDCASYRRNSQPIQPI